MQKEQDRIKAELKALIAKGNTLLNAGQNKQRATAYLYVIFSLISLSFFGLIAIGPTISTIFDLNKQLDESRQALKQLEDKNTALKALSAQYIDIQDHLDLIDNAIPQSANVARLTRKIEELSIQNNLAVQKIDTGLMELFPAKNTNSPIFSFTFSLGVSGAERDINNFISQLINIDRIISIEKLTTGKRTESIYTASITGKAFFYKE